MKAASIFRKKNAKARTLDTRLKLTDDMVSTGSVVSINHLEIRYRNMLQLLCFGP